MRKEIPFQEVIPLDKGIAVVNGGQWSMTDLQISIYGNSISKNLSYDSRGVCVLKGLSNKNLYTVEIRRTDLKGMLLYKILKRIVAPRTDGVKYVVLVGASVGKAWEFGKLPYRINWEPGIVLGYRCRYDFDKTNEIKALVDMPVSVSGVIIKECAAYFPIDLRKSKTLIKNWIKELRSHHIIPILATVVPVTKEHDEKHPGRFGSIMSFNDFIRDYTDKEAIGLLDLEKALRISEKDRHLRDEYANPDGLHLLEKAYLQALDKIVLPVVKNSLR